jgi:hypothetical protein
MGHRAASAGLYWGRHSAIGANRRKASPISPRLAPCARLFRCLRGTSMVRSVEFARAVGTTSRGYPSMQQGTSHNVSVHSAAAPHESEFDQDRGRLANAPCEIPARGWKDVVARVQKLFESSLNAFGRRWHQEQGCCITRISLVLDTGFHLIRIGASALTFRYPRSKCQCQACIQRPAPAWKSSDRAG